MPDSLHSLCSSYSVENDGFTRVAGVLDGDLRDRLTTALGAISGAGRRGLLSIPLVRELATSPRLLDLVRPYLPAQPMPVRTIFFDKSPESNWGVPWHQDLTIAVQKPIQLPGFGPWSVKEEVPHVQPPVMLLERMITIRLHLDACDASNGALQVLPGSHRGGRLTPAAIQAWRAREEAVLCTMDLGDALLMRPLLLHASHKVERTEATESPHHRRILHIEYAGFTLPGGLQWHEAA